MYNTNTKYTNGYRLKIFKIFAVNVSIFVFLKTYFFHKIVIFFINTYKSFYKGSITGLRIACMYKDFSCTTLYFL